MDALWTQMMLGVMGTMVLGVATNLVTPPIRRVAGRAVRRSRSIAGRAVRATRLRGVARRVARSARRFLAFVRA
jgi:hypothetical protein